MYLIYPRCGNSRQSSDGYSWLTQQVAEDSAPHNLCIFTLNNVYVVVTAGDTKIFARLSYPVTVRVIDIDFERPVPTIMFTFRMKSGRTYGSPPVSIATGLGLTRTSTHYYRAGSKIPEVIILL